LRAFDLSLRGTGYYGHGKACQDRNHVCCLHCFDFLLSVIEFVQWPGRYSPLLFLIRRESDNPSWNPLPRTHPVMIPRPFADRERQWHWWGYTVLLKAGP
jgi:hypothetical protein